MKQTSATVIIGLWILLQIFCVQGSFGAEGTYVSPKVESITVKRNELEMPKAVRKEIAQQLANRSRDVKDLTLKSKLIALALFLDPDCREAIILDAVYKGGSPALLPADVTMQDTMNRILVIAKKLRMRDDNHNALAGYMLDVAAGLSPSHPNLQKEIDALPASCRAPDWSCVNGKPAAGMTAATGGQTKPLEVFTERAGKGHVDVGKFVVPEYENKPKKFAKRQATIKGLVVTTNPQQGYFGRTMDIIVSTFPAQKAKCSFRRPVGKEMTTSMEEARDVLRMRYPIWATAEVSFSFGDKYSEKDGGSAGTAFALLLLSILDGVQLDKNVAITGDITVDWKTRKVGGVPAKIMGAVDGNCSITIIPASNRSDLDDLYLFHSAEPFWRTQIFTASTLKQASDVARADRSKKLAEAITLFSEIQTYLSKTSIAGLKYNKVKRDELKKVIELVPNHESARMLLAVTTGKGPKKLSEGFSVNETMFAGYVLLPFVAPDLLGKQVSLSSFDGVISKQIPDVLDMTEKRLLKLEKLVSANVKPMCMAFRRLNKATKDYHFAYLAYRTPGSSTPYQNRHQNYTNAQKEFLAARIQAVAEIKKLGWNREFMEKVSQ